MDSLFPIDLLTITFVRSCTYNIYPKSTYNIDVTYLTAYDITVYADLYKSNYNACVYFYCGYVNVLQNSPNKSVPKLMHLHRYLIVQSHTV